MDLWLIAKIAMFCAIAIAIVVVIYILTQKHLDDQNKGGRI